MGGLYSNAIYVLHDEIIEAYVLLLSSGFDLILSHLISFTVIRAREHQYVLICFLFLCIPII